MSALSKKKGLGRGIGAMLGSDQVDEILEGKLPKNAEVVEIPLSDIAPNPNQPRETFDEAALQGLAASIQANGILQPIVVQKKGKKYNIIAGERRFRAAKISGLNQIPAIVRDVTDLENISLALIENIQREGLNAIEEAKAYKALMETFNLKQQELAERVGKDRATIANTIRLLDLPQEVQQAVVDREFSHGHARTILSLKTNSERMRAFEYCLSNQLSVRQLEQAVKEKAWLESDKGASKNSIKKSKAKDAQIKVLESELQQSLGTKVQISHNKGKGKIEIYFYDLDDFDRIKELLT